MAIRLTESRLRQIIREEASKLTRRPTRSLRESPGAYASAQRSPQYTSALHKLVDSINDGDPWAYPAKEKLAKSPEMSDPMEGYSILYKDLIAAGIDKEMANDMANDISQGNPQGYQGNY